MVRGLDGGPTCVFRGLVIAFNVTRLNALSTIGIESFGRPRAF